MTAHPPAKYTIREYLNDRSQGAALGRGYQPSEGLGCIGVPDPDDEFTLYIILIGIQGQVCEAHEVDTLFAPATQHEITTLLIAWYHSYSRWRTKNQVNSESPFCLLILWHSTFVSLFSNLNDLEIAVWVHRPLRIKSRPSRDGQSLRKQDALHYMQSACANFSVNYRSLPFPRFIFRGSLSKRQLFIGATLGSEKQHQAQAVETI